MFLITAIYLEFLHPLLSLFPRVYTLPKLSVLFAHYTAFLLYLLLASRSLSVCLYLISTKYNSCLLLKQTICAYFYEYIDISSRSSPLPVKFNSPGEAAVYPNCYSLPWARDLSHTNCRDVSQTPGPPTADGAPPPPQGSRHHSRAAAVTG